MWRGFIIYIFKKLTVSAYIYFHVSIDPIPPQYPVSVPEGFEYGSSYS